MVVLAVRFGGFVRSDFRQQRPSRPRSPRGLRGRLATLRRQDGDRASQYAAIKLDDVQGPVSLGPVLVAFRFAQRWPRMQYAGGGDSEAPGVT